MECELCICLLYPFLLIGMCLSTNLGIDSREVRSSESEETVVDFMMPGASPNEDDQYMCTYLKVGDAVSYITKYEVSSTADVAHHILLYGCGLPGEDAAVWHCGSVCASGDSKIMYAWAKNAPPTVLPKDVGYPIGGQSGVNYLVMQIHYLHSISGSDNADHSGLKLTVTNQMPQYIQGIYLMLAGGTIPPDTPKVNFDMSCKYNGNTELFPIGFRTHAHSLARVISGYKFNGSYYLIGKGNPQWPQAFYPAEKGVSIKHGDILVGRCSYNSTGRSRTTYTGSTHNDEMCNFYIMYYTLSSATDSYKSCGGSSFSKIVDNLPTDSDTPLPPNPLLDEMASGHHHHPSANTDANEGNVAQGRHQQSGGGGLSYNAGDGGDRNYRLHDKEPSYGIEDDNPNADMYHAYDLPPMRNDEENDYFNVLNQRARQRKKYPKQETEQAMPADSLPRQSKKYPGFPTSNGGGMNGDNASTNNNGGGVGGGKVLQGVKISGAHSNAGGSNNSGMSPSADHHNMVTPSDHHDISMSTPADDHGLHDHKENGGSSATNKYGIDFVPNFLDEEGQKISLGQISGVAVDSNKNIHIFHRGPRVWDGSSFDGMNKFLKVDEGPIKVDTLLTFNSEGHLIHKWGSNMFYMSHGLHIDSEDNIWLTDVALHQVFKFKNGSTVADLTLGVKLQPGHNKDFFCKPTDVAVLKSGEFFVADGYCNSRILKYSKNGQLLKQWGSGSNSVLADGFPVPGTFTIPHSIVVLEDKKWVCVADRENGRIQCFDLDGTFIKQIHPQQFRGRLFAVTYNVHNGLLYAVNGPNESNEKESVAGFVLDPNSGALLNTFSPNSMGFKNPHDLALSASGEYIYIVEIKPNKLWKFKVDQSYLTSGADASAGMQATLKEGGPHHHSQSSGQNDVEETIEERDDIGASILIGCLLIVPVVIVIVVTIFLRLRKKADSKHGYVQVVSADNLFEDDIIVDKQLRSVSAH